MTRTTRLKLETGADVREAGKLRAVVLEWEPGNPDLLTIRAKGTRQRYTIPAGALYVIAAGRHADQERRRKAEERKARRAGNR